MRVHRLEITAFGPFAGTEVVDFDTLSSAGLFLVHGPTGAGKTSTLDAICFALFGQVPGARNQARELRSDHAAPERAPSVELEVTIRGRRLRIVRSPRWMRPKRRGAGTTEEQAKVTVEELTGGDWMVRTTRVDEAGQLLSGLLGMTAEQFCQVVLLPQGAFARFLRAGAEERRDVLERLFATHVFADVEKWLADRRTALRREAAEARKAVDAVADRITGATDAERPADRDDLEALPGWVQQLRATTDAEVERAEQASATAREALDTQRARVTEARELTRRQEQHAAALRRREELDERAGTRRELTAEIEAARRAERVLPLIATAADKETAWQEAERAATRALAEVNASCGELAGADPAHGTGQVDLEQLHEAERTRRDETARLAETLDETQRLVELETEIEQLTVTVQQLRDESGRLAHDLDELPERHSTRQAKLATAREHAARREHAQAALDSARARLEAAERRDALTAELATAEETLRADTDTAQELRDRLQALRQARLSGMAAELAGSLERDLPCPVCGSPDHPEPAPAQLDAVTAEEEERVRDRYEQARDRREQTQTEVTRLRTELREKTAAAGEITAAAARAELDERAGELSTATGAATRVQQLGAELERLTAALDQARERHQANERELATAQARHAERQAAADQLRRRIDAARGDDPSLQHRVDRLAHEADLLQAAAKLASEARSAAAERAEAERAAEASAGDVGFADTTAARQAARDADTLASLEQRARALDDEEAAVGALLADADLQAAAAQPAPDMPASEAALEQVETDHNEALSRLDRDRDRARRLVELETELGECLAAWRPTAGRFETAHGLAQLAAGTATDNHLKMKLSAYVLAARLEQVAAAANERLDRMSHGRYTLAHTAEKEAGQRRGGLGLRVIDTWTGQERDPATLSGGETFFASLALALGLASVVTAEAGGAEIATLFVDEGFGSLDADTLDEVMDVLDELRDGGRVVGIVSHVADLKDRIPTQLRARKARAGSTLELTR